MNAAIIMNSRPRAGAQLQRALGAKLQELLAQVAWLRPGELKPAPSSSGLDFIATLPLPDGRKATLCIQCKAELRPSQFAQFAAGPFSPPGNPKMVVRVLGLPFVTPRLAELCAQHGWSWFDLAGNCFLDIPGLLRLEHNGHPPVHKRPRPAANLSTPEAGRVIRALLLPENAGMRWTQREMQNHSQPSVSLGLVNKVVRHLRDEALLEESDDGFRLRDPLRLLFAWRDAYRFDRHQRLSYFTLLQGPRLRQALCGFGQHARLAAYASFSAADFQAPYVRQPKTWLYVRLQDLSAFEKMVQAKPVDSGENVVVLVPDDEGIFYMAENGAADDMRLAATNEVQTYVDLWHSGGRGQEAAEALLNQRLKPAWHAKGLSV